MAELFASVNGRRVISGRLFFPWSGVWLADVELDGDDALEGAVSLRVAGLDLKGVVSGAFGGTFGRTSKRRIVGGAGGWAKVVAAKDYHNDAQMTRAQILSDVAAEVGETLTILAGVSGNVGAHFARPAVGAWQVLDLVLAALNVPWWVEADGTTRAGTRPETEAGADVEVLTFDPLTRVATLSMDKLASLGVGTVLRKRLDEPAVIRELEVTFQGGKLRAEAWCGSPAGGKNRIARALAALVKASLPNYVFAFPRRYRVFKMTGDRVDLQAVSSAPGLPDVLPVSQWPGLAGLWGELALGAEVLVEFIDGDPVHPIVTHFAGKDGVGWTPVSLVLDASSTIKLGKDAALGVARMGDFAGPYAISTASTKVKAQ